MNQSILLFGGSSGERLVSVASAQNLVENFDFNEIIFLDHKGSLFLVSKEELQSHQNPFLNEFKTETKSFANSIEAAVPHLKNKKAFLAFHGTEGEDGKIQKLFEDHKICFTASGSLASHNAFDKKLSKDIVAKSGIRTIDELLLIQKKIDLQEKQVFEFLNTHLKIVLKPVANGSSLGLFIVENETSLNKALQKIKDSDFGDYLAEKFIQGRELTVGVYQSTQGLMALPPSEVLLNVGRSFDYEGKYLGSGSKEITPAALNSEEILAAQKMALAAHQALNCYGYSRTDMILTTEGPIYLETNTLPGLSRPSFLPQQLKVAEVKFSDFIKRQLELAEKRY